MQRNLLVELLRHCFEGGRVAARWCLCRLRGRLLSVSLSDGNAFLGNFSEC